MYGKHEKKTTYFQIKIYFQPSYSVRMSYVKKIYKNKHGHKTTTVITITVREFKIR